MRTLYLAKPLTLAILLVLSFLFLTRPVIAMSCWKVTGWSSNHYVGAQALVITADCSRIPYDYGWTPILENEDIFFRIPLNDNRVEGWIFKPLLWYSGHDDEQGKPIVLTTIIVSNYTNETWLTPFPPTQGIPTQGDVVRLRHQLSDKCIYSLAQNGAEAKNKDCWRLGDTNMEDLTYVLDDAGNGIVRLRHQKTGQCLYAQTWNGTPVQNWVCWNDPNMQFSLDKDEARGGYRLRNVNHNQCIYGNPIENGSVRSWNCWSDPNMVYNIDIIARKLVPLPVEPPQQ